jgi:hypothetical protein
MSFQPGDSVGFEPGDCVVITHPHPEHKALEGKTATVHTIYRGFVVLKGVGDGIGERLREALISKPAFWPDELTKS